jgi:hypothetical protein
MSETHYYSNYANSRDIDCFFRIGNGAYHFASNGQPIPGFVTRKTNLQIQDEVYQALPNATGDVETHRETVRGLIMKELGDAGQIENSSFDERTNIEGMIDEYADSFKEMARMGFISMDLDDNGRYHIIATPKDQVLSQKIMGMLPDVQAEEIIIE